MTKKVSKAKMGHRKIHVGPRTKTCGKRKEKKSIKEDGVGGIRRSSPFFWGESGLEMTFKQKAQRRKTNGQTFCYGLGENPSDEQTKKVFSPPTTAKPSNPFLRGAWGDRVRKKSNHLGVKGAKWRKEKRSKWKHGKGNGFKKGTKNNNLLWGEKGEKKEKYGSSMTLTGG